MTTRITKAEGSADGVHRLVDMVVEEVSLVDRAANKHRFLIVKRDDAMDDDTQSQDQSDETTPDAQAAKADGADTAAWAIADGSPLGTALAALESLTAIVELLGSLGADQTDTRLAALAQQLRATAEQLLERSGFAPTDATENASPDLQARAKGDEPEKPAPVAVDIAAAKQALTRLAELVSNAVPAKTEKRAEPAAAAAAPEASPNVVESLAKLADSFRTLSETVKEQQQRLGRVEKHFGLPNSAAPAEQVALASVEDVGWPLDLNEPKDRESVDKAVSFHDL